MFSYTFEEAITDGYITPAMDAHARGPALEILSKHLLESFGYNQINYENGEHDSWDLVLQKCNQKLWVECKAYKSQDVSPYVANELLKTLIMRKMNLKGNVYSFWKAEVVKNFVRKKWQDGKK